MALLAQKAPAYSGAQGEAEEKPEIPESVVINSDKLPIAHEFQIASVLYKRKPSWDTASGSFSGPDKPVLVFTLELLGTKNPNNEDEPYVAFYEVNVPKMFLSAKIPVQGKEKEFTFKETNALHFLNHLMVEIPNPDTQYFGEDCFLNKETGETTKLEKELEGAYGRAFFELSKTKKSIVLKKDKLLEVVNPDHIEHNTKVITPRLLG